MQQTDQFWCFIIMESYETLESNWSGPYVPNVSVKASSASV